LNPNYETMIARMLKRFCFEYCKNNKPTFITHRLGWQDKKYVNDNEFILKPRIISDGRLLKYYQPLNFEGGSKKEYCQFLKNEIFPFFETRLALVIGLSSIISSRLEQLISIGTLVLNLSGTSSTGKSTMAEFIASLYATPILSNTNGIVKSFNATTNGLFSMCEGLNGVPIILDDSTAKNTSFNFGNMIYQLSSSETKARCQANGSLQGERLGWSGLAIITSESPIVEIEEERTGAMARTIFLDQIKWTRDASHSERIKKSCRENYGYVAKYFAKYISKISEKTLLADYGKAKEHILSLCVKKDNLTERIVSKIAPIYMCAEYLRKYFKNKMIDPDKIIKVFIDADAALVEKRDIYKNATEKLVEFIYINKANFYTFKNNEKPSHSFSAGKPPIKNSYGVLIFTNEKVEVRMYKKALDIFFASYKITEKNRILDYWLKNNFLYTTEKGRFTVKTNMVDETGQVKINERVYKFIILKDELNMMPWLLTSESIEKKVAMSEEFKTDDKNEILEVASYEDEFEEPNCYEDLFYENE